MAGQVIQGGIIRQWPLAGLMYVSQSTSPMTKDEIREIAVKATARNAETNITGILLYGRGRFVQFIEGEELPLRRIYDRIGKDTRHEDLRMIGMWPLEKRLFKQWHMGMINLDYERDMDDEAIRRASELFDTSDSLVSAIHPGELLNLIKRFSHSLRREAAA